MQRVWEDAQGNASEPYERWSNAALEGLRDTHTDSRLKRSASDELSRRALEQGMHLLDMQDAPTDVLEILRDQHQNPFVQAWAAERLSRLAEQRYRAVVPSGCKKAEEAAG